MAAERPYLEVQIHAPDIRRGVRYLFLSRRGATIIIAVASSVAAFLAWAVVVTPSVVRSIKDRHDYEVLVDARVQHGRRLHLLVDRLDELAEQTESVRLRMEKVYLAYGLRDPESSGQGGFPLDPAPVPDSIYGGSILHGNRLAVGVKEQMSVIAAFLEEVQEYEEEHGDQVHTTPSISPLLGREFVLTSPFGTRRNPFTKGIDFHAGIDLAASIGTEIRAPSAATVVFAGRYDLRRNVAWWRYGRLVVLRHDERFITLYGHCDEIAVKRGQQVAQGDVIATVGNTGWSTNPHLHYEVRRRLEEEDWKPVDPRIYILDHRWRDEERLLVRARSAPEPGDYEPLPRRLAR